MPMSEAQSNPRQSNGDALIAVTMSRDAAARFKRALTYADAIVDSHADALDGWPA